MPLRLRTSTVRRDGHTYRYHQLTRAIRRDGKPTHEIVAHLGRLGDAEAEAIRLALLALAPPPGGAPEPAAEEVVCKLRDLVAPAALRYLDVMVVHRLWQQWGLRDFFERHLAQADRDVAPADVVEVLVSNRCLAPCSKLRVTEWMPRTVLPELLGIRPDQFNNTRIHRVLAALEGIEPALTDFLVAHPRRTGFDSVIYLDFTDTWFVGDGGDLAAGGKCKDGSYQPSRIQIALAVDHRGLPLRWELLAGNASEKRELPKWIDALADFPAFDGLPLVFDRGLSTNDNLRLLVQKGRRFVTCATQPRLRDWTNAVDFEAIVQTPPAKQPSAECLKKAGLVADAEDDDLFYVDQGVRIPHTTTRALPEMRVVLFFRASQYAFDTHRIAEARKKLRAAIDRINETLAQAKVDRQEDKTLARVRRELHKRQMEHDYKPRLERIRVHHGTTTAGSFRVHLDEQDFATGARDYNAGWRILLASKEDDRPAHDLIRQYDQKQAVEDAFRTIKSFVQLKPIRHQRTARIRAHVTLCVLAMMLDRWLEILLREAGVRDAVDRVYEALEPCRLLVLRDKQNKRKPDHLMATELDERQRKLLAALEMKDLSTQEVVAGLGTRRY